MNYIKDVQSTPTTCAASLLDELENHIFYIFQNFRIPPPPLPPQNDVTNCHNFGTPSPPLRRDVIFERRQIDTSSSFQKIQDGRVVVVVVVVVGVVVGVVARACPL